MTCQRATSPWEQRHQDATGVAKEGQKNQPCDTEPFSGRHCKTYPHQFQSNSRTTTRFTLGSLLGNKVNS